MRSSPRHLIVVGRADEEREAGAEEFERNSAVAEAHKFMPYGADVVSPEALWSPTGRAVYAAEPGRFERGRLELLENSLRDRAAGLAD
jgi:hypothetical protein